MIEGTFSEVRNKLFQRLKSHYPFYVVPLKNSAGRSVDACYFFGGGYERSQLLTWSDYTEYAMKIYINNQLTSIGVGIGVIKYRTVEKVNIDKRNVKLEVRNVFCVEVNILEVDNFLDNISETL